ncbi:DNA replication complex GINS family protein [Candidatus Bathyarchaeota archaeon]|nr:DNA replication complex GINS family protein [Candidatus Bathyarchaeota archaeon]
MVYSELYETWKRELENRELEKLPPDFYSKAIDYLKKLREEGRMLDKRTIKANLLRKELRNAKRMISDIIQTRYRKVIQKMIKEEKVSSGFLTIEEEKIYRGISPLTEAYSSFAKEILSGHIPKINIEQNQKRAVLRFLKGTPPIVGVDMKAYGPFKIEDIASLPVENAKIMIKQGLAEKVEITLGQQ